MINKNTLEFLKDLKLNNSNEWLNDNKKLYENAKNDILTLTAELIASISDLDTTISNAYLDPKKCITRLNRDLRFAKVKTPYKTDYYIVLNKNEKIVHRHSTTCTLNQTIVSWAVGFTILNQTN